MSYLSRLAIIELKLHLLPDVANIIDRYIMTVATIKTEYYEAVITGDLVHIKWLHTKYPTVIKLGKTMAELALAWQQYKTFDYLTLGNTTYDFSDCKQLSNMEHIKRRYGNIDTFTIISDECDNPLILDLPKLVSSIGEDLCEIIYSCINNNRINILYALLHKPQYRLQLLDMKHDLHDIATSPYLDTDVIDNLVSPMLCDFFGMEITQWYGCVYKDCENEAKVDNKWCQQHNPKVIRCDYMFSRGKLAGLPCGKVATNGTKCHSCAIKKPTNNNGAGCNYIFIRGPHAGLPCAKLAISGTKCRSHHLKESAAANNVDVLPK